MALKLNVNLIFSLFSVIVFVISCVHGELSRKPLFTIFSPKVIQPNRRYNVTVFTEYLEKNISVHLNASCDSVIYSTEENEVPGGKTRMIGIDIKELASDTCSLTVKVKQKESVWDSTTDLYNQMKTLYVASKSWSILIECDKPIYKPGEIVKYRILFLNRQLRPITVLGVEIKISDPQSAIIRIHKNESIPKGLFSSEIKLSKELNLGDWEISAKYQGEEKKLSFSVVPYILPIFKVEVKLPPFIVNGSSNIMVEIKAMYAYGKKVKGQVTVKLRTPSENNYYLYYDGNSMINSKLPIPAHIIRSIPAKTIVTMPIDGSVFIDLEIPNDVWIKTGTIEKIFSVEATVKENYSGIQQNATGKVQMFDYPYKIEMIDPPKHYHPGFPLNFTFRITSQDDIPISDSRPNAFEVSHGFAYDDRDSCFKSSIPATGLVRFSAMTPSNENILVTSMKASYKNLKKAFPVPEKISSATKTYISVVIEGDLLKIKTNKPMKSVNYLAVSQGQIIESGREEFSNEKIDCYIATKVYKNKLGGPKVTIIVFVVFSANNEMVVDSVTYSVRMSLSNYLNIEISKKSFEPEENITISLDTNSASTIALRAVDQSVFLLKENKNIDSDRIEQVTNEFNEEIQYHKILEMGGYLASRIFDDAGIVIFTNCYLEEQPIYPILGHDALEGVIAPIIPGLVEKLVTTVSIPFKDIVPNDKGTNFPFQEFPESWIWETIDTANGKVEITKKVPHTLTSWVLTGFSLNSELGIGVSLSPQTLETFRPFFISFNLPYSVTVGSVFALKILLHNYMNEEISGVVAFKNVKEEFEFVESTFDISDDAKLSLEKNFKIPPLQVLSVTFTITLSTIGEIKLEVEAQTKMAGDAISKSLKVVPKGLKQQVNSAVLLDLRSGQPVTQNLFLILPDEMEKDVDRVRFSIIGDLLGFAINNLDQLLQLPHGCGEQNMVNFVPNIVILDYLKASRPLLTSSIKKRAIKFLEMGYQRELTYRHADGSFSAFGTADSAGSTWLTAFVARSFISAKRYTTIDGKIIVGALDYLTTLQKSNGMFIENGESIHSEMHIGASSGIPLTAYVLLAFIDAKTATNSTKYNSIVRNALEYLSYKIIDLEDPYALILICYVFHLTNHHKKDSAFMQIKMISRHDNQNEYTYWSHTNTTDKDDISMHPNIFKIEERPVSVEMTAYALQTFLLRNEIADSIPIVKWLLTQRNSNGGFMSTQDTVVGLTALAKFAIITKSAANFQLFVSLKHSEGTQNFLIGRDNEMVLQEYILPWDNKELVVTASGKGMAIAQLSWNFYTNDIYQESSFNLSAQVTQSEESPGKFELHICSAFTEGIESNMVVMEVNLPSGFIFESGSLSKIPKVSIMRFEEENDHTKLNVYFTSLTNTETCVDIEAFRLYNVVNTDSVGIIVYDYYDTSRKATTFYQPPTFSFCQMCAIDNQVCDYKSECSNIDLIGQFIVRGNKIITK